MIRGGRESGFDFRHRRHLEKLAEELREVANRRGRNSEDEFGDVDGVAGTLSGWGSMGTGASPATGKFRRRFGHIERVWRARQDLRDLDLAAMDELWNEAKAIERGSL